MAYLGNRRLLCKDLGSFGVVGVSQHFDWSCFRRGGRTRRPSPRPDALASSPPDCAAYTRQFRPRIARSACPNLADRRQFLFQSQRLIEQIAFCRQARNDRLDVPAAGTEALIVQLVPRDRRGHGGVHDRSDRVRSNERLVDCVLGEVEACQYRRATTWPNPMRRAWDGRADNARRASTQPRVSSYV